MTEPQLNGKAIKAAYAAGHDIWQTTEGYKPIVAAAVAAYLAASPQPSAPQCCMCGKTGMSTAEGDGGTECELSDGRWVCSQPCWEKAVDPQPPALPESAGTVVAYRWRYGPEGNWCHGPEKPAGSKHLFAIEPLYAAPSSEQARIEQLEREMVDCQSALNATLEINKGLADAADKECARAEAAEATVAELRTTEDRLTETLKAVRGRLIEMGLHERSRTIGVIDAALTKETANG